MDIGPVILRQDAGTEGAQPSDESLAVVDEPEDLVSGGEHANAHREPMDEASDLGVSSLDAGSGVCSRTFQTIATRARSPA
jgi:hypothetical protein